MSFYTDLHNRFEVIDMTPTLCTVRLHKEPYNGVIVAITNQMSLVEAADGQEGIRFDYTLVSAPQSITDEALSTQEFDDFVGTVVLAILEMHFGGQCEEEIMLDGGCESSDENSTELQPLRVEYDDATGATIIHYMENHYADPV